MAPNFNITNIGSKIGNLYRRPTPGTGSARSESRAWVAFARPTPCDGRARYADGAYLPTEAELAAEFAVGRSTVREVVRVLVSKGMLEVRPRNGTRVRPRVQWRQLDRDLVRWTFAEGPDPALLHDLIEVRRIVEPEPAALAAERAVAADLVAMENAFRAMEAALPDDLSACVAADVAFHSALLCATGNTVLKEFETMIEAALGAAFQLSTTSVQSYTRTLAAHWRFTTPSAAARLMLPVWQCWTC